MAKKNCHNGLIKCCSFKGHEKLTAKLISYITDLLYVYVMYI